MKKLYILLFVILCFGNSFAQTYSFSQTTGTYSPLSGATTVTTAAPWFYATSFNVPIGFTFNFMGTNYSNITVEGSGFTIFDPNYYYLILPYGVQLQSKGTSGNNSPIAYKTEGVSPNRIAKIQWMNAGFLYDTTQTVNFQLWLYETSNTIEVHIGYTSISNPATVFQSNGSDGPVVSISKWTSISNCNTGIALINAPAVANAFNMSGNISIFSNSLNAPPVNGTIYSFTPNTIGVEEETAFSPNVFYDPSQSSLIIQPAKEGILYSYLVINSAGQLIANGESSQYVQIQNTDWLNGLYIVQLNDQAGNSFAFRFLISGN
jgi:hypothetical protein